MLADHSYH